jgi:nitrile hydratase accessory protein
MSLGKHRRLRTLQLNECCYFSSVEWTAALGAELSGAARRGEADDGTHYYDYWLAALEKLVVAKGLTDTTTLSCRKQDWLSPWSASQSAEMIGHC